MRRKKTIWCKVKRQDGTAQRQPLRRCGRKAPAGDGPAGCAAPRAGKNTAWKRRAGEGWQGLEDFLRWMLYPKTSWQRPH